MKFEKYKISDKIKSNLTEMGFFRTTDIQFKVIPAVLEGEDVLAIAQTGTGKTAAFAIPLVERVIELKKNPQTRSSKSVKSLVLVPTRELAQQIGQVFSKIAKKTGVSTYAVYGGVDQDPQIKQLTSGADILIATPGRMFDLISQGFIDISRVYTLVLDEADYMLDLGFIEDIESVKRKLRYKHQTLFFSATINKKIKRLAYSQVSSNALRIQVSPDKMISKNISHYLVNVEQDKKRHLLHNFCASNPDARTIVFVRTQVRAERVLKHLAKNDISATALHGGLDQEQREKSINSFRKKEVNTLIATDVSARGIDMPGVSHVINYDLPDEPENYVHRIGRTGRGFSKGDAVSFYAVEDQEKKQNIEEFLKNEIPVISVNEDQLEEPQNYDIESMDIEDIVAMEEARAQGKRQRKKKK